MEYNSHNVFTLYDIQSTIVGRSVTNLETPFATEKLPRYLVVVDAKTIESACECVNWNFAVFFRCSLFNVRNVTWKCSQTMPILFSVLHVFSVWTENASEQSLSTEFWQVDIIRKYYFVNTPEFFWKKNRYEYVCVNTWTLSMNHLHWIIKMSLILIFFSIVFISFNYFFTLNNLFRFFFLQLKLLSFIQLITRMKFYM